MTYHIEYYLDGKWIKILTGSKQFLQGYLTARREFSPRPHLQLVRSDGRIVDEMQSSYSVGLGQVAGWPTAEQYDRAGNEALERARYIRERIK
jgi:hypothetical protein